MTSLGSGPGCSECWITVLGWSLSGDKSTLDSGRESSKSRGIDLLLTRPARDWTLRSGAGAEVVRDWEEPQEKTRELEQ